MNGKRQVSLVTFADSRLSASLSRLVRQAEEMQVFTEIFAFDEMSIDRWYREELSAVLHRGCRGYGYWSWKPQIILQALERIEPNSVLLYLDAGCHLNPKGRGRLIEYIDLASTGRHGIVAFQAKPPTGHLEWDGRPLPDLRETRWTKGDVLDYFGVRNDESILNTPTIGAGVLLLRKEDTTIDVINEWREGFRRRFDLFDDSPSASPNPPGFVEHRHDQSFFSIMCKKRGIETLSAFEYWYPRWHETGADWEALAQCPIHAKRDKKMSLADRVAAGLSRRVRRQWGKWSLMLDGRA